MNLFDIVRYVKLMFGLVTGRARLTPKSDTACVVVGMENSRKYGSCPGSLHDSNEMGRVLSKYGRTTLLQDRVATADAVRNAMTAAVQKDLAVFYYSGHGGRTGDSEFLCAYNGPVWDHQIWDIVSKAKGRVVLIFDCCHSGHMYRDAQVSDVDWPGIIHSDVEPLNNGFEFKMLRTMPIAAGEHDILVWSGCPKESYSYGDSSGGVFTNGLLKGLKKTVATYDSVWSSGRSAASSQRPVRTVMGSGFNGLVFR